MSDNNTKKETKNTTKNKKYSQKEILNINVGILGHVDSGKTSISKQLSNIGSTASFDKSPDSKKRGITLDLGFSAVYDDNNISENIKKLGYNLIQYTLVDCPGHASLIKTIIGGSQIIDLMVLVIDATKGIQTQTAECIVLGEVVVNSMIIILNKVDLVKKKEKNDEIKTKKKIEKLKKMLKKNVFQQTKFKDPPIIEMSTVDETICKQNIPILMKTFSKIVSEKFEKFEKIKKNEKKNDEKFLCSVDHCFPIKGKGTVMTGTILKGNLNIQDLIEIPSIGIQRKVKSIQSFGKNVNYSIKGDRIGLLITQIDSKKFERGFISSPNTLKFTNSIICSVEKVKFYKNHIKSKSIFHVTIGHQTVLGEVMFFSENKDKDTKNEDNNNIEENQDIKKFREKFFQKKNFLYEEFFEQNNENNKNYFVKIDFQNQIICYHDANLIASKLDLDVNTKNCRLAFHGKIKFISDQSSDNIPSLTSVTPSSLSSSTSLSSSSSSSSSKQIKLKPKSIHSKLTKTLHFPNLKVFKNKQKTASIDRVESEDLIIGKGLVKKKENIIQMVGKKITLVLKNNNNNEEKKIEGIIDGTFGGSGKFKVKFMEKLPSQILKKYKKKKKKKKKKGNEKDNLVSQQNIEKIDDFDENIEDSLVLSYKINVFDIQRNWIQ